MYFAVLKLQMKRICWFYFPLTLFFVTGFLFIPYNFAFDIPHMFLLGLLLDFVIGLCVWAYPLEYINTLPVSANAKRFYFHITPIFLSLFPLIILILCYTIGCRRFILEHFYNNHFFVFYQWTQVKMLLLSLLFMIFLGHVNLCLFNISVRSMPRDCITKRKAPSCGGWFAVILVLFLVFANNSPLSIVLIFIFAVLNTIAYYIDPSRRDTILDLAWSGDTYNVNPKRAFIYALLKSILSLALCIFAIWLIFEIRDVFEKVFIMIISLGGILLWGILGVLFGNFFYAERMRGNSWIMSFLWALFNILILPFLNFVKFYRYRNSVGLRERQKSYEKYFTAPVEGESLKCKLLINPSGRFLELCFILGGIIAFVIYAFCYIKPIDSGLRIETFPAGIPLKISCLDKMITVNAPVFIDKDLLKGNKNPGSDGFTLLYMRENNFFRKDLFLYFIPDKEIPVMKLRIRELKASGSDFDMILKRLSAQELWELFYFMGDIPSSYVHGFKYAECYGIKFTSAEYELILGNMIGNYLSKINEQDAVKILHDLSGDIFYLDSWENGTHKGLASAIINSFPALKTEYRRKLSPYSFKILAFLDIFYGNCFDMFSNTYDPELMQDALLSSSSFSIFCGNPYLYWQYILTYERDTQKFKKIIEYLQQNDKNMSIANIYFLTKNADPSLIDSLPDLRTFSEGKKWKSSSRLAEFAAKKFYHSMESLKPPVKTDSFIMKRFACVKNYKDILFTVAVSQDETAFPLLKILADTYVNMRAEISSELCCFDGKLTALWIDYIRKNGTDKENDDLNILLKTNASFYWQK